jgi:hypothetical protein
LENLETFLCMIGEPSDAGEGIPDLGLCHRSSSVVGASVEPEVSICGDLMY